MAIDEPDFRIGMEEEFLLVDTETGELVSDPPNTIIPEALERLGPRVSPEFLRSQIEVQTTPCDSVKDAAAELREMRSVIAEVTAKHGIAPMSASTHPWSSWREQLTTEADRYELLAQDMQLVMRRLVICGMHVHVSINDEDMRIDMMNQVSYFLPHLLALTTSSPFWHGTDSGLKSYRKSVFKAAPRTGLPEQFNSWAEYERHVDALVGAGLIEDASKIWWDVRPSARYPTLEMRIADICTTLDDGLAVAALYQAILRMLYRMRTENRRWRSYANFLVEENVWRAQRYGVSDQLVDFGKGELVPFSELTEELIGLVAEDAVALDTVEELDHVRTIVERGTSADRQLAVYYEALAAGAEDREALRQVVMWLISETQAGVTKT